MMMLNFRRNGYFGFLLFVLLSGCASTDEVSSDNKTEMVTSQAQSESEPDDVDRFLSALMVLEKVANVAEGKSSTSQRKESSSSVSSEKDTSPSPVEKAADRMAESSNRAHADYLKSADLSEDTRKELIRQYQANEIDQRTFERKMNEEINRLQAKSMRGLGY